MLRPRIATRLKTFFASMIRLRSSRTIVCMDLPAWISAVASAGALAFAVPAATAAYRVLKIEAARDEAADEERRVRKATRVSAWFGLRSSDQKQWGVLLRNASDAPVYGLAIGFYVPTDFGTPTRPSVDGYDIAVLPPSDDALFVANSKRGGECRDLCSWGTRGDHCGADLQGFGRESLVA